MFERDRLIDMKTELFPQDWFMWSLNKRKDQSKLILLIGSYCCNLTVRNKVYGYKVLTTGVVWYQSRSRTVLVVLVLVGCTCMYVRCINNHTVT